MSDDEQFQVGDIVSRDGTDEHEVIETDVGLGLCIRVRCIKAPAQPWTDVGDEEFNLARRYGLVRRPTEATASKAREP